MSEPSITVNIPLEYDSDNSYPDCHSLTLEAGNDWVFLDLGRPYRQVAVKAKSLRRALELLMEGDSDE